MQVPAVVADTDECVGMLNNTDLQGGDMKVQ